MTSAHNQPGRRIATGSNRADHVLAMHGFVAHMTFFMALAAGICYLYPEWTWGLFVINAAVATTLLVIRALQVGITTTKESISAIREAWGKP